MSQSKETGNKMKCYRRLIRIQYSQDPIKTCRYRLCHEVYVRLVGHVCSKNGCHFTQYSKSNGHFPRTLLSLVSVQL